MVATMEGHLQKQRDVFAGWRQRYFVLEGQYLRYYENRVQRLSSSPERGSIFLEGCRVRTPSRCCCACDPPRLRD